MLAGSEIASAPKVIAGNDIASAPASSTANVKPEADPNAPPFSSGPTQISITHVVTKADDGSKLTLTIDGTDAGSLGKGEKRQLFMAAGKHKVGGYVKTLFGYGRVTIDSVDVTTTPGKPVSVTYSVTRNKPTFALQKHR
ncbi:hypothetical protein NV64_07780 [Erwinia sp. B116]|nr:hypothetical protein [Erwinia sp. B116]PLV61971.1 hypothetical protein NV64_07780 [Erwinia sp. B116]